jgi:L-aspartate oxidase
LHGANRLASNSLLEALVFAENAAVASLAWSGSDPFPKRFPPAPRSNGRTKGRLTILHNWDRIRTLMWHYVGIARSIERLQDARRMLAAVRRDVDRCYSSFALTGDLIELRSIAETGGLIVRCALRRRESRGLHYVEEFPRPDPRRRRNTVVYRRKIG